MRQMGPMRLWDQSLQAIRLIPSQRKIFSQRMPLPIVGQQDAAQIRMLVEDHTEQIVGLAFMPVGSAPDTGNAWHMWVFLVQKYLEPDAMKPGRGKQMIVELKERF